MAQNGNQRPARPRIEIGQTSASPEEAAAIAVAIEQFLRDSARPTMRVEPRISPWLRASLLENAGLDPAGPDPWSAA